MPSKKRSQILPSICEKPSRPIRRISLDLEAHRHATRGPVARGGFSDVFKIDSPEHGLVAVKRLRFSEHEQDALQALLEKEAAVLAMLEHPHILALLGISYIGEDICIVTPWADNGPMSLYLARHPDADRLELVASALNYLHTGRSDIVIHGDLHLDNVLISENRTALLSDFGLSRVVPQGNSSSLWRGDSTDLHFGRATFDAPELHDGARRSWATDVFALGMLIFHAFSGEQPFRRLQSRVSPVIVLYHGGRPNRREIRRSDFSDDLWRLVQQCWAHAPRQRPRMPEVSHTMQNLLRLRSRSALPLGIEAFQSSSGGASNSALGEPGQRGMKRAVPSSPDLMEHRVIKAPRPPEAFYQLSSEDFKRVPRRRATVM